MSNKIFEKAIVEKRVKSSSRRPRYALRKLSVGVVSCLIGYAFLIGGNVSFAETDTHPSDKIVEVFEKSEILEEKITENISNISDEKTGTKKVDITSVSSEEKSNSTENFEEKREIPVHNEKFTVVFDANGGKFDTENNTLTVNAGENATFSEIPSFSGKIFVGWASSPDATEAQPDILQNISSNKTVYAVWKADETTIQTEHKPIVTSKKPEDTSDYVSLNFNTTSFTENDGTLHYGKLLNENNEEVETNNEIEGVKTRTYWVLKSATWKDVKDFTDKDGKNVYQNLTANSGDEKHPFLGWADSSSLDTVVNLANKFEDTSVIGENPNDGLNFYAKYRTNDVIYYGKTDTSNPMYDSDGYKINLNSDYNKVTFKLKDEKIGKVYLKEEQKNLLGKDVATNDDGSITLTDAEINDKEITAFVHKSKVQYTGFRDIKIETDSIDKNYQYWFWYRAELDDVRRQDDWDFVFPPSLNGIKNPVEVCFVPFFVTNGQDVTEFKSKPAPPKMPLVGNNSKRTRFELITLKKEEQIDDILRKDGKSYFDRTYVVFREYKADFIFEKHPSKKSGSVLPELKEEFKYNYTNPHWYDNQKRTHSYYDDVDLSNEIIYKSKIYTARATRIPVIHEINEASEIIQGTAETGGVVNLYVDGKYSGEAVVDNKGRWKFKKTDRFSLKEGSEIEIQYSSYKRTLPASAKIIVKKAADNIKFNPIYTGSVANPGDKATVSAPKFINELNKSELVDNSIVKKFELLKNTIEGVSIDEKTGEITYNTKESDSDKTIDLNVKVTYLDDTTENVNTTIKINPLPDIINREENLSVPIPDGYVRVRIIAGEGVRLKETEKIYDIKKGLSLSEDLYPEVEINPDKKNDYKEPISWTISPGEAIENSVDIVANATKTQAFLNSPIGKDIKILEGETIEAAKLIDNLQNLPANTTYEFKEKPDTKTARTIDATIIVKYSDGSVDQVKSKIIVQKQAAIITSIPEVEAIDEIVDFGKTYDLSDNIKNLPEKAKVEDITEKGTIDTQKSGDYIGKVKVTFENGATRIINIKVVVNKSLAETNEPVGKDIKILEGETIEAAKLIDNLQNLPANTTYEFKEKPDTKTARTIDATIIVKYSDGSVDQVKSKIIVQKQAAIITPIPELEAIDEIVDFGKSYDLSDNIKNLPEKAKVEDITEKGAIDTQKSGNYIGKIKVTFENGATRVVNIKVVVNKSLAETNELVGKDIKILEGETIEAKDLIVNLGDFPADTTYEFKEKPDTKIARTIDATIIVKYSDGSVDEVKSTIIVQKQAAIITPIPEVEAIDEIVDFGKSYDLTDNIKNLPGKATVEDITEKGAIDTQKSGNYIGKVKVTFENGATKIVKVKVVVNKSLAEINEPVGKEIKILEEETIEAADLVENSDALPENTTFEFKEKPDTTTARTIDATIIVKYSDGSFDEVKSTIIVQKQAAIITPIPEVEAIDEIVDYGKTYDLLDNIKNLPGKATVEDITEKGSIDTQKSGNYIGKVKVTFENGATRIVRVKVVVNKSLAETNEPVGKEIKILEGETIEAKDLIVNSGNLPADTTYEFKEKSDTTTAGTIDATIIVKYSDGSVDKVKSKIIVQKQAAIITPIPEIEAIDEIVEFGKSYDLSDNIKNLPEKVTVEDITEKGAIDTQKSGNYIGKVKVTFENGATRIVNIKVVVNKSLAEKFVPEIKIIEVESEGISAEMLESAIINLPKDSKLEIKAQTEGKVLVSIKFGDGSEKDVEISYKIKQNNTDGENTESNNDEESDIEENKPDKQLNQKDKDNEQNTENNIDTIKPTEENIETKPQNNHQTSKTSEKSSKRPEKLIPNKKSESNSKTTQDKKSVERKDDLNNEDIAYNKAKVKKSNPKSQLPKAGTSVEITNLTFASFSCIIGAYFTKKKK